MRIPLQSWKRLTAAAAIAGLATTGVAACGSDDSAATTQADSISISEQWIKAAPEEMTAAFGVLTNTSPQEARLTAATSDVSDDVEIHEVVDTGNGSTMRPIAGGLALPAGADTTLAPGGDHLMFMGLKGPINSGDEVTITLTFADGSTTTMSARARDFQGGEENYEPGGDMGSGDMGGEDTADTP